MSARENGDHPVALVTGGTRGIGAAIATKLSGRGASVVISARTPAEVPADGVELVVADAATIAGAERLASEGERVLGEVDILGQQRRRSHTLPQPDRHDPGHRVGGGGRREPALGSASRDELAFKEMTRDL